MTSSSCHESGVARNSAAKEADDERTKKETRPLRQATGLHRGGLFEGGAAAGGTWALEGVPPEEELRFLVGVRARAGGILDGLKMTKRRRRFA